MLTWVVDLFKNIVASIERVLGRSIRAQLVLGLVVAYVIFIGLLFLGAYIAVFWGILLIAPLTATIVEIYKYVRHSIKVEETQ